MPPKRLPQAKLKRMKRRFRRLIDEAFDGNLSMAARELEMPVSTVHQYYQDGPRRFDVRVAQRIEHVTRVPIDWLLGEGEDQLPDEGQSVVRISNDESLMADYPPRVSWRVDRVRDAIRSRTPDGTDVYRILFAPLKRIEQSGLIDEPLRMLRGFPADMGKKAKQVIMYHRERAHLIHVLCSYWEAVLEAGKVPVGREEQSRRPPKPQTEKT